MDTETDIEQEVQTQEQDPTPKLKVKDFAAKIKAKYPQYKDVNDTELTNKIIEKYPDYKDQIDFGVDIKKKEDTPLPSKSLDTPVQSPSQKTSFKDPIIEEQLRTANMKSNEGVSSGLGMPKSEQLIQEQQVIDRPEKLAQKKQRTDRAVTEAAQKVLANKGDITSGINSKQFLKEKDEIQKQVENGNVALVYDKKENDYVLKRTTGFWETYNDSWNKSTKGNEDADKFVNSMDSKQRVEYLKQQEDEVNKEFPYAGKVPSKYAGSLGEFTGENAPMLVKAGTAALVGSTALALAPETLGASISGLPTAMAFLSTAPDMVFHGAKQEIERRFYKLKKQHSDWSDEKAMDEADNGKWIGAATGLANAGLLMTTGGNILKTPISEINKNLIANTVKGTINAGTKMGVVSGGLEALKQTEGLAEGIEASPQEIFANSIETAKENFTLGAALHLTMLGIHKVTSIPPLVYNAAKKSIVETAKIPEVKEVLEANEKAGNVPEGTTKKVTEDLESYKEALNEVPKDLPEEAKSAVAGLIQKRENLVKENAPKEQIETVDNQISEINKTGKIEGIEFDNLTGEKYEPKAEPEITETKSIPSTVESEEVNQKNVVNLRDKTELDAELTKQLPDTLSSTEKQGSIAGGEGNAIATAIVGKIHAANEAAKGRGEGLLPEKLRGKEEQLLKANSKENGTWIEDSFGEPHANGFEQDVYLNPDGKTVTKIHSNITHDTWNDLFHRIAIHNALFPDVAYTLKGFTNHEGQFSAVFEQPLITKGNEPVRYSEVTNELSKMGFEPSQGNEVRADDSLPNVKKVDADSDISFINKKTGVKISDLHGENVMKGTDGKIHFIDPIIELTNERKETKPIQNEGTTGQVIEPIPTEEIKSEEPKVETTIPESTNPVIEPSTETPTTILEPDETTSIKNEVTGNKREELGLNKADEVIAKDFGSSWDEAKQKIDKGYKTQDLVDELKKKPRAINDVEDALLLHHQNSKEIELMDTNDFINKASENGNEADLVEGKIRRARILDELQDTYNVNKAAGTETARGLSARRMMTDRKYNLVNMMAEKRASNDGKPLSAEQEKEVEALHTKIKETQKAYDDYVKEAETEIKGLQEKILGKKVVNKKSAADKLREWADKIDDKTKGQTLSTIIPITPKMISGAMRLIADGLEKGGEVLDLIKKAIEEIKNLEPNIDEQKLNKAINKEVIDSGITVPTSKENKKLKDLSGITLDRKLLKLKADAQRAKDAAEIALKKEEEKKRTFGQKAQDTFIKWQRAFKLSNPVTMGKLVMAGSTRLVMTPLEDVVGGGFSKLLPKLSKGAIGEGGGLNVKETAQAYKNGIIEGMKDSAEIMKREGQGKSDLDVVFGKTGHLPPEAIDFFGQLHSATKAPFKRFMFERSLSKRLRRNIANGVDVSDPLVQTEIAVGAYKDANRAIFMQDNKVTTGWQKMVNYFDTVDKKTGKAPSKPIATTLQFLVPFVKVPTNIAAEIGTNVYGVPVGVAKIIHSTFKDGMEKLPVEEKDIILRNLKKGTLGLAALSLGYFNPQIFGGYYQDKEKRKPEDAKAGSLKINGVNIPAWLIESPIFQAMQVGATVRRVKDAKVKGETKGITEGVWAGALGMAEHVPMLDQPLRIFNAIKDEKERDWYVDELAKNTIEPALLQKIAEFTDKGEKRVPKDFKEHMEMGIPGLRQNVSEKIVTTNNFSDKTKKFLEEKKVELPKSNFTYRKDGKQVYMTQDEATKFNNLRNEYIDEEVKKIPTTKYDITEENADGVIIKSAQVLGKELDKYIDKEEGKTELQKKIDAISKKATEIAKTKMGLEKQKNEVLVEEH